MNTFEVGQIIKAKTSAQGLKAGYTYRVEKVIPHNAIGFTFVTYMVQPVDERIPNAFPVQNAHLLCEAATAPAQSTKDQLFGNRSVDIVVHPTTKQRFAAISQPRRQTVHVPIEMLGLAAGKDAWMRDILFRCADCKTPVKAGDAECELCPACYEKAGEENHRLDTMGAA